MVRSTPKAIALGAKLREKRSAAGLSQRELGKRIGLDSGAMSRIESGERPPDPETTALILGALGVNGEALEEVMALARDETPAGSAWLAIGLPEQTAQLEALLGFEQLATNIIDIAPLVIPGLLQTGDYARAIMRASNTPANEIPTRVAVRLGRAEVLTRSSGKARLTAFIGEAALRAGFGGAQVMADQRHHLLTMGKLPNVNLRVFRTENVDWNFGFDGPSMLLEIDKGATVVYLENRRSGLFLQGEEDVAAYQEAADHLLRVAMDPEQSAEFIESVAR